MTFFFSRREIWRIPKILQCACGDNRLRGGIEHPQFNLFAFFLFQRQILLTFTPILSTVLHTSKIWIKFISTWEENENISMKSLRLKECFLSSSASSQPIQLKSSCYEINIALRFTRRFGHIWCVGSVRLLAFVTFCCWSDESGEF